MSARGRSTLRGLVLVTTVATIAASGLSNARGDTPRWQDLLSRADSLFDPRASDSSIVLGLRALHIADSLYGDSDTNVALILHRLGFYHNNINTSRCEEYFRKALRIWESTVGANPVHQARTVNNLGILAQRDGRYEESAELFQRALDLKRRYLGPDHPAIATTLYNMSGLYMDAGRNSEAEWCLQQASAIWQKPGESVGPAYYLNCSALYRRQFRYSESIQAAKEAIRLFELQGEDWLAVVAKGNLAETYSDLGLISTSDSLYSEMLAYCDTLPDLSRNLYINGARVRYRINIARTKRLLGHYDLAEQSLMIADSLAAAELPDNNPERYRILHGLGRVYRDAGRYALARRSFESAEECGRRVLGENHPRLAPTYRQLALTRLDLGMPTEALNAARRAVDIAYAHLPSLTASVPEHDALSYATGAAEYVATYLEALQRKAAPAEDETGFAIQSILRTKGVTHDILIQRRRDLNKNADESVRRLRERRRFVAEKLANTLLDRGPGVDGAAALERQTDSLRHEYRQACSELALEDVSARVQQKMLEVTKGEVERVLTEDAPALDYYAFGSADSLGVDSYAVVAVDRDRSRLVWLSEPGRIDDLMAEYLVHMAAMASQDHAPTTADLIAYRRIARTLYDEVLGPIEPLLKGKRKLFVSPAGRLNLLSFAGLIDASQNYLVESFEIHYLNAIRELAAKREQRTGNSGLLALADPDFDSDERHLAISAGDELAKSRAPLLLRGRCAEYLDSLQRPLPGTRFEIDRITDIWHVRDETARTLIGSEATEGNLKLHAPGKRVLHIATHGFYLRGDCTHHDEMGSQAPGSIASVHPLLASGLLLAGARRSIMNPYQNQGEDGILSALEVADLELSGVKLVTLSACESGLGALHVTEGVYGLRRAFELAGADAVLASLWQVSDDVTARLMTSIYENWDTSVGAAVRQSQLEFIETWRNDDLTAHPFLWAAFLPYGGLKPQDR